MPRLLRITLCIHTQCVRELAGMGLAARCIISGARVLRGASRCSMQFLNVRKPHDFALHEIVSVSLFMGMRVENPFCRSTGMDSGREPLHAGRTAVLAMCDERICSDEDEKIENFRLRGGGGDGGSTGAESRSSYLEMYQEKKLDKVLHQTDLKVTVACAIT
jgi:hypothetical protein